MTIEAILDRLDNWIDDISARLTALATLARELGADYIVLAFGLWLTYRIVKPSIPLLISSWERDRRHQRNHERKMKELRVGYSSRKTRANKKDKRDGT